jgi:hypothetical protein
MRRIVLTSQYGGPGSVMTERGGSYFVPSSYGNEKTTVGNEPSDSMSPLKNLIPAADMVSADSQQTVA